MKVNFHWLAFDWPKRQKNNINIFALAGLSHKARPSPFFGGLFFCGFEKKSLHFFLPVVIIICPEIQQAVAREVHKQCVYGEAVGQQKVEVVKFFYFFHPPCA